MFDYYLGTYSTGALCEPCQIGTYSNLNYKSTCQNCDSGTYSLIGFSACLNCSVGAYSASAASNCIDCTLGMIIIWFLILE